MAEGEPEEGEQLQEVAALTEEEVQTRAALYEELFAGTSTQEAKEKSRAERKEAELTSLSLTYSEVDFGVVQSVLSTIVGSHGPLYVGKGTFLDLGSGVGRACFGAALLHPFAKVVGVETVGCLNEMGAAVSAKYQELQLPEGAVKPEVQLIKGDFVAEFEAHIQALAPEVSVCFASATCFGDPEMQALVAAAKLMPANSFIVTLSQALPEAMVRDENRQPKQRRAVAVRKALSRRGVEPDSVGEIVADPSENDPEGFTQVHADAIQVPWGSPVKFWIYKKVYPEQPEQAAEEEPPAEAEDA